MTGSWPVTLIEVGISCHCRSVSRRSSDFGARRRVSISYVKPRKTCNNSRPNVTIDQDVPFRRCPPVAVGNDPDLRAAGVFARSDNGRLGRMGRTAGPQPGLSHTVGTHLARGFPGSRPLPTPAAPTGARMAVRRGLRTVRLHQRGPAAGRRHQPQQRSPRRRPGGLGRLLDGPALCRAGADDGRLARRPALRLRRPQAAPPRGRLPAAQRALQGGAGQGRLPRGGPGAAVPPDQWPVGGPSAVRPAARGLRYAPEIGPLDGRETFDMRNLTPASITQAFADYAKNAPSERTRTLLVSLAGHLHSFVRENSLTQAEWTAAIDALTRATQFTDDKRNEYILFSDLLGVSSLVDMVNAATSGTPSSVLGPFHIEGAPELANGGDLWRGQVGEPLVVSGRIADEKGAPAKGAVLALWQNAGNGLYAQQDQAQSPTNYHARLTVAPDGSFAFTTVRPVSYTVPDDGPAGDMLRALGRDAWRPAHLHMIIHAPGHKPLITEFFPEDDKYLDRDAVFGVRAGLVLPFRRVTDRPPRRPNPPPRDSLPLRVGTPRLVLTPPPP